MTVRTITEILNDHQNSGPAAVECLFALDQLPHNDIARPDYRAAAITLAILSVRGALHDEATGCSVGEAIRLASGVGL